MSAILDNLGILAGGGEDTPIFGINCDAVIPDATHATFKAIFGDNDVSSYLRALGEVDIPENNVAGAPFAYKIIGVIWNIYTNNSVSTTNQINILIDGVEVASNVLTIGTTETGYILSEALDIDVAAGERVQFQRVRSGSTNAVIYGTFALCINYN